MRSATPAKEGDGAARVAMVVPFIDHLGGMERIALALAERFHQEGIPTVIHTCRHLRENPALVRPLPPTTVPIRRRGVLQRSPLLDLTWILPAARQIAKERRSLRAILAHQAATSGVLAGLANRSGDIPFGVITHGGGAGGDARLLRELPRSGWRARLVNRARFVTSPNEETDQALAGAGIDQALLQRVPNGCDTRHFRPPSPAERAEVRGRLDLPEGSLVAVYAGRLTPLKRLPLLLEGIAATHEPWTLVVAGEGPERAGLQAQSRKLGLEGRVRFTGLMEDPRAALWAGDLFCLPSDREGMSVALLEAMACGLPAAVSDIPANTEVVKEGRSGLVVPGATQQAWKEALTRIAGDEAARRSMGTEARARVESAFDIRDVHQFYVDWYRSLERDS